MILFCAPQQPALCFGARCTHSWAVFSSARTRNLISLHSHVKRKVLWKDSVWLYQSLNSCEGILVHSSLQHCFQFIVVCGCSFMQSFVKVLPQPVSQVEVWTFGHCNIFIFFFFSHCVIDLLLQLWSLSCCTNQFWPIFSFSNQMTSYLTLEYLS